MTTNPREAKQFATKKQAAIAASTIGWRVSDATPIEVMGFRLWAIADDHMRFIERTEYDHLLTARVETLTGV